MWLDAYLLFLPDIAFVLVLVVMGLCTRANKQSLIRLVLALILIFGWLLPIRRNFESSTQGSFRLVTLNIQAYQTELEPALLAVKEQNPDFVCLQEVWHRPELEKVEALLGGYQVLGAASDEFERRNFNEGTFVAVRQDWALDGSVLQEEAALLEVSRASEKIVVVSVHGPREAGFSPRAAVKTAEEQTKEAEELASELKDYRSPIVIAGDFNAPDSGPAFKILEPRFHSAFHQVGTGLGLTFPSRFPLARIDHVLGNEEITFTKYQTQDFGSDHLGVIVDFNIR